MSILPHRLKEAMSIRGIRATALAEATGLSKARISQYTHGVYSPNGDALCRLANALSVSEAWLLGKSDRMEPQLTILPEGLERVRYRPFPVLGDIACGAPLLAVEQMDEFISAPEDTDADFILVAKGDSMIDARIFDGDEVFIKHTDMVNNGEIAAVILDDEATLKKFFYYPEENRLVLQPANPKYDPMIYQDEDLNRVRIVGRAVSVLSKLN
ncbi:MAG: helix-turn-helix domain-containing protein [Ruminococcaceae bacterium]|nr:helix-turn-helix domain-containing protein [Oscillospiraceae bacterium]